MVELKEVINIALQAGEKILEIYNADDFDVQKKSDDTPITLADSASHNLIKEKLLSLYPKIPVLSEEGKSIPYEKRKNWNAFWLVDPLDGTKEFIKKNGEFTVNIALIDNNEPILGIIYAPAFNNDPISWSPFPGTLYYAEKGIGSFKQIGGSNSIKLPCVTDDNSQIAVRSRSHASVEEEEILKNYEITETIFAGSSLKFCLVAEGLAKIYYRHGPTNEWDVAAGYAIAKYSGSIISGLTFNKKSLLNKSFMVTRTFNKLHE